MKRDCPYCHHSNSKSENQPQIIRVGYFRRKSDHRKVHRFFCKVCNRGFSAATNHAFYRQNKRQVNYVLMELYCSGVSERRIAKLLHINLKTVARKIIVLGRLANETLNISNAQRRPVAEIQFDDLETFEHTKCKPLSVTLATEHKTRRILGFEVSRMNARGPLRDKAIKKYGRIKDERNKNRERLFEKIQTITAPGVIIHSDQSPHYVEHVKQFFPGGAHIRHKGRRGAITGQGELKKTGFDPLFTVNHTCAMLRANINRLFRKTWCTTKKRNNLHHHIAMYVIYHNFQLLKEETNNSMREQFTRL